MPATSSKFSDAASLVGGRIARIDVYNFKSYGGKRTIGPFVNFTAVIGPNGAGVP